MVERPVFIVAPPRAGQAALLGSLARAPGMFRTAVNDPRGVLDSIFELDPQNREWDSNRLTAADAQPRAIEEVRGRLKATLVDKDGDRPGIDASGVRWLDAHPGAALRVPFLRAICPDAFFVYIHREPEDVLPAMLAIWESEGGVFYPELPDWEGPPWSLPLVPGWRELSGKELPEIVTEQWMRITKTVLDDLESMQPDRWCVADWKALLDQPRQEVDRLCQFVEIEPSDEITLPLRTLKDQMGDGSAESDGKPQGPLADLLPRTAELAGRSRELVARPAPEKKTGSRGADSPLRSVYTQAFPQILEQLRSSLLVTTYQTGKLITARHDRGTLNTHFRNFDRPMGLTAHDGRFALGTRAEVLDYRNFPAVASKIEPKGTHDACFVPRNKHFTGDIRIHEVAFAQGELWLVATNFSCLATLDAQHSFIPRWTPPFITELTNEDRCHLNGLCVIDDRVQFVTALGETNEPGGWRENKASGGIVINVDSGNTVVRGLSMPHSPRWYQDKLWVLESGKGTLSVVDLDDGSVETVAEMPGFTRGLVFGGGLAFVGLSQVRETATFGGLPIEQLEQRQCGVWVVDPEAGRIVAFLRFEELVQEIFEVTLLRGFRYPEIADERSDAASQSFELPDAAVRRQPAAAG